MFLGLINQLISQFPQFNQFPAAQLASAPLRPSRSFRESSSLGEASVAAMEAMGFTWRIHGAGAAKKKSCAMVPINKNPLDIDVSI